MLPVQAFAGFGSWFGGNSNTNYHYTDHGINYDNSKGYNNSQKSWMANAWDKVSSWVKTNVFRLIVDFADRLVFGRKVVARHSIEGLGTLSGRIKLERDGSLHSVGDGTRLELDKGSLPLRDEKNHDYRLGTFEYDAKNDSYELKADGRKASSTEKDLASMIEGAKDVTPSEWKDRLRSDYAATADSPETVKLIHENLSADESESIAKLSTQYRAMQQEGMVLYAVSQNNKVMRLQQSQDKATINFLILDNNQNQLKNSKSFYLKPADRPLSSSEQSQVTSQLSKAATLRSNGDKMAAFKVEDKLVKDFGIYHVVNNKEQMTIAEHGELVQNKPAEWEKASYNNALGDSHVTYNLLKPNDGYPNFKSGTMSESYANVSLVVHKEVYDEPFVETKYSHTDMIEGYKIASQTNKSFMKDMIVGGSECYSNVACGSIGSKSYNVVLEDKYEKDN